MSEQWQVVYRAENIVEASLVKSRLEDARIPVMEKGEAINMAYGFMVGPLATIEILVPASRLAEALEVLNEPEAEPGSPEGL